MAERRRIVAFCHSLISDWNHGNAHFLRGIAREFVSRGWDVDVYEPDDGWSLNNLIADQGMCALDAWRECYPMLRSNRYDLATIDLDQMLEGAELVLVHEWNDPALVAAIGAHRRRSGRYVLLFHDTHHRMVSDPDAIRVFDLESYDGVLAFGEVLREAYLCAGWARHAFTWHEAADIAHFRPPEERQPRRDLVWVGNWGDDEREAELAEFLIEPVRTLGLETRIHGVRYPAEALRALERAGIAFAGYLPNHRVPAAFAEARATVHVPRRHYVRSLPGIPTIRMFEALACGIPLASAPWDDFENLFTAGDDYLAARDGAEMRRHLRILTRDTDAARAIADHGAATIRSKHTCGHRVDELLAIAVSLGKPLSQLQSAEA